MSGITASLCFIKPGFDIALVRTVLSFAFWVGLERFTAVQADTFFHPCQFDCSKSAVPEFHPAFIRAEFLFLSAGVNDHRLLTVQTRLALLLSP